MQHLQKYRRTISLGLPTRFHRRRLHMNDLLPSPCGTGNNMKCDQEKAIQMLADFQKALNKANENVS